MGKWNERISQAIRAAVELLNELQAVFPPLQAVLGQVMITAATLFGLAYVLRLLSR